MFIDLRIIMHDIINKYVNYLKLFIMQPKYNSPIMIGDFNLPNFNWKEYTFPSYSHMHYFKI